MITVTLVGRIGKNAEVRQAGQGSVCSFSVAGNTGFGNNRQSHWFICSLWDNRGTILQPSLVKGQEVVIVGEYSEREYNGKQYKELKVHSLQLVSSKSQSDNPSYSKQQALQNPFNNNMSNQTAVDTQADDSISF